MISWPAANGIICSSCKPIATDAPSGTYSAMASRIERILVIVTVRGSAALPSRGAFLHESANALFRIFRCHQLFQIDLFGTSETFFEVHRLPRVACLFCRGQGSRAQPGDSLDSFINNGFE